MIDDLVKVCIGTRVVHTYHCFQQTVKIELTPLGTEILEERVCSLAQQQQ